MREEVIEERISLPAFTAQRILKEYPEGNEVRRQILKWVLFKSDSKKGLWVLFAKLRSVQLIQGRCHVPSYTDRTSFDMTSCYKCKVLSTKTMLSLTLTCKAPYHLKAFLPIYSFQISK